MIGSSMRISLLQDGLFFRKQSERFGIEIFTETVTKVDFSSRPFKRLSFVGSGDGAGGFWNRGISAGAVCDGAALIFRNKPLVVIGGGDSAMEKVYIIHRCDTLKASKIMWPRALSKPKIELIWNSVVEMRMGKLELDEDGYVVTKPGTNKTNVLFYEAVDF
ncbi:hypothetical protein DY000_02061197 [Brassica cretica]|uniref:FAD/NAD(P)-binding domain-containing protein n=1 Tax=Brassica cretica TaxID=69181 RepID=A0ABQ7B0K6_BRACR|nr:hypothetical protein DY000_02061197 [Brassica cretica]